MIFDKKQRFSIRKYSIGVCSVLLGMTLLQGAVLAEEAPTGSSQVRSSQLVDAGLEVEVGREQTADVSSAKGAEKVHQETTLAPATQAGKQEDVQLEMPQTSAENTGSDLGVAPVEQQNSDTSQLPTSENEARSQDGQQKLEGLGKESLEVSAEKANAQKAQVEPSDSPQTSLTSPTQLETIEETETVSVLIKLKEPEKEEAQPSLLSSQQPSYQQPKAAELRQDFLREIRDLGIHFKLVYEFDTLFNGFVLETSYRDGKRLAGLSRVDKTEFYKGNPARDVVNPPQSKETTSEKVSEENTLINLQPLWDKGIKGQGQLVAVIDSGLDPEHEAYTPLQDLSKAKYKSAAEIETAKKKAGISYGKWYSDKIVYVHNYSDLNEEVKEEDPISHGAHVAGSALANSQTPSPNGEVFKGVAPEAQLMFLRVFSDSKAGGRVQTFVYTKALEDAIKLGADVVNMSLGTASGSLLDLGEITREAFEHARKAGVTVTIAATNMATNGFWYGNPLATTPDYGMVGTPSVNPSALSVASLNSLTKHESVAANIKVTKVDGQEEWTEGKIPMISYVERDSFRTTIPQNYVYLPQGEAAAYQDADTIANQVVLIEKGGAVADKDKVSYLKAAGAAAVLFYQSEEEGDDLVKFDLGSLGERFPIGLIGHRFGKLLAENPAAYQLHFDIHFKRVPYEKAGEMSDFSSWGLTADGDLKPDVTLPGGMIYSSVNNNEYYMDRGTSMASPHAAGALALVKQVLKERFPGLTPEARGQLAKLLTMSTAVPHINPESKTYSSVRQQGAGVMDVTAAAYGDVIVTSKEGEGSLTLGNVDSQFQFSVTVHNLSDQEKRLSYRTIVATDDVKDGRMTLKTRELEVQEGEEIVTLAPHASRTIQIQLDVKKYAAELEKLMPNGYFIEGFVFFKDTKSQKDLVSIPYIGFKGDYQNLRGIEKPIYDYSGEEKPFYYYKDKTDYPDEILPEKAQRHPDHHFTSLFSYVYDAGTQSYVAKTLGQMGDSDQFDGNQLYFSPNGDPDYDRVNFKGVMLRNVDNVHLSIYKAGDKKREQPIFEAGNESNRKTDWSYRRGDRSVVFTDIGWDGRNQDGQLMEDGAYQFVVTYRPSASAARKQEISLLVHIDNTAPQLAHDGSLYDASSRRFKPGSIIEEGSGLAGSYLSYEQGGQTLSLSANEDGSYTLPEGVDPSTLRYYIWDKVSNTRTFTIDGELTAEKKDSSTSPASEEKAETTETAKVKPSLELVFTDDQGNVIDYYPLIVRYQIVDQDDKLVAGEFDGSQNGGEFPELSYGSYRISLPYSDEHYDWGEVREQTVTISQDNPRPKVTFTYHYRDLNRFSLEFDQSAPEGTRVTLLDAKGKSYDLAQSKYDPKVFEAPLFNATYRLAVSLPDGYAVLENLQEFLVENRINRYLLHLLRVEKETPQKPHQEAEQANPPLQLELEIRKPSDNRIRVTIQVKQATNPEPVQVRQPASEEVNELKAVPQPTSLPNTGDSPSSFWKLGLLVLGGLGLSSFFKSKKSDA